jgi:hypothetical protein
MLEIQSNSKGLLIPRLTTAQRIAIASPKDGLMVFDSDKKCFYLYGENRWNDLSTPSGIWQTNASNVYLSNSYNNVGIGTSNPTTKLVIQADATKADSDPIFEIRDKTGGILVSVTSEGARFYVKDVAKGVTGGFAVGQYGTAKASNMPNLLSVTSDSVRIYVKNNPSKGVAGGFAVGQYGTAKGNPTKNKFFFTNQDSTRVYTNYTTKGVTGGFAVGQYGTAKGTSKRYMHITPSNYFIGHSSGAIITTGLYNSTMGYETGKVLTTGNDNTFLGYQSGIANDVGERNVFLGSASGFSNSCGSQNFFAGYRSGYKNTGLLTDPVAGCYNVFLGYQSGYENTLGFNNVFIGSDAGHNNTSGQNNVLVGTLCGEEAAADFNVFVGFESGRYQHNGNDNVYIGNASGKGFSTAQPNTGFNNVFLGKNSGLNNRNGHDNVFVGTGTGMANQAGNSNVFIGNFTGSKTISGSENTVLGAFALVENITGSGNVALGSYAMGKNTSGVLNTAVGYHALYQNTIGQGNSAFGEDALRANISGDYNTAVGASALSANTGGRYNTAVGTDALLNSNESYNTAVGYAALRVSTNGKWNTALGYGTLRYNQGGTDNIAVGNSTMQENINGAENTAVGNYALLSGTSGTKNVALGFNAGKQNNGNGNIFIGYDAGFSELTASNKLYIDNSATNAPLIYGEFTDNAELLKVNGTLTFNKGLNSVTLPAGRGLSGNVLITDGNGGSSWSAIAGSIVTASNGIHFTGQDVRLGGSLSTATTITSNTNIMTFTQATIGSDAVYISQTSLPDAANKNQWSVNARTTNANINAGTSYAESTFAGAFNSGGIKGYNYNGAQYSFGLAGWNFNDNNRCAGTFGSDVAGNYWGALGYKASDNNLYGVYSCAAPSFNWGSGNNPGGGKSAESSGIGVAGYGSLFGSWFRGDVYGTVVKGERMSLYVDGKTYTNNIIAQVSENSTNQKTVTYVPTSMTVDVYMKGTGQLTNGKAEIKFDSKYLDIISDKEPIIVTVTPVGKSNGIYLENMKSSGFTVSENNDGKSSVTFTWIAVATRKGFENPDNPKEILEPKFDENLNKFMFNENDTKNSGQALWWDGTKLNDTNPPVQTRDKK